ncbi:hypothetical protein CBL_07010 [Carabus blaptoides fortunei]
MADSAVEKKETVTPAVEKEADKPVVEKVQEEEKQAENGDAKENGDKVEEEVDTSKEAENGDATEEDHEACPVKRKSAGGDAPEGTPAEGASPEKKAKLEEKPTAEAEANGAADAKTYCCHVGKGKMITTKPNPKCARSTPFPSE